MKNLILTLALVTATGCTTLGTTTTAAKEEAPKNKNSAETMRDARQQALLEALGADKAQ